MDGGLFIGGKRITNAFEDALTKHPLNTLIDAIVTDPGPAPVPVELLPEIVDAMEADNVRHEWDDVHAFVENVRLRYYVVQCMRAVAGGLWDCNYAEPAIETPPSLHNCNNGYFFNDQFPEYSDGPERQEALIDAMNVHWKHLDPSRIYATFTFYKAAGKAFEAVRNTLPFRGECCGAAQLSILRAALLTYGPDEFDAIYNEVGLPMYVGSWFIPNTHDVRGEKHSPPTFAGRFIAGKNILKGGEFNGVPGDYFYYQNVPEYLAWSEPGAGWQGENCIYLGKDFTGTPRFSGMGLTYESPFSLHFKMYYAALGDCNARYLAQKRAGKTPKEKFHVIDPNNIRFTVRSLIGRPKPWTEKIIYDPKPPAPDVDGEVAVDALTGLGMVEQDGIWSCPKTTIGALTDAAGLDPNSLVLTPSAPFGKAPHSAHVGDMRFVVTPLKDGLNLTRPDAEVAVTCHNSRRPDCPRAPFQIT